MDMRCFFCCGSRCGYEVFFVVVGVVVYMRCFLLLV